MEQIHLLNARVFVFLMPDVRSNRLFIPTHRRNKVSACPEMLTHEISLRLSVYACQMYRALSLDIPDHLGHRILRRYRNHHVYVVGHQMPFLDYAFLAPRQLPHHLSQMLA